MVYRAPTLCLFVSGAADVSQSAIVNCQSVVNLLFPLLCWLYSVPRSPSDILSFQVPRARGTVSGGGRELFDHEVQSIFGIGHGLFVGGR